MNKINFVNGIQPAINDTNLNQMQTNFENAIAGSEIEEQGTDLEGAIHYIKYKDGKLVQYGGYTWGVVADTEYYKVGYRTAEWYFGGQSYPVPFTELYGWYSTDVPEGFNTLMFKVMQWSDKLTKLPKWHWISADKISNRLQVTISFLAIGRWK